MTTDPELQRILASAVVGKRLREGVSLIHPGFSQAWNLTTEPDAWGADDGAGATIIYKPGPIAIVPAGLDESGRGEMQIRIATLPQVCEELVAASALSSAPLTLIDRVYISDELVPRLVVSTELAGLDVDPGAGVISGVASMPNLDGMMFPRLTCSVDLFPGLDRA